MIPAEGSIFWPNGTSADHVQDENLGIDRAEAHPVQAPSDLHAHRPLMVLLALGVALAMAVGTEYVAWQVQFDPRIGPALFALSEGAARLSRLASIVAVVGAVWGVLEPRLRALVAPLVLAACIASLGGFRLIYAPYRLFSWYAASAAVPAAAPTFRSAWLLVGLVAIAWSLAVTDLWGRGRSTGVSVSHGSAHWGTGESLWGGEGLLLGRDGRRLLRFSHEGHVLTVAPTRSGKGVSAVIPNLLDHPGSVLVTDPKGENFAVTATWRKSTGQAIHAFDPFGIVGGKATYNPLDLVDAESSDAVDDARMLADMIVLARDREGEEAFWNEEARGLLTGLILHAAAKPETEYQTLAHVRQNLTLAPASFWNLLENEMLASKAAGGLVARAAARLLQKSENERSGVVSTAQSHTHFLDSPRMAEALANSSVDLASLKQGSASVYLILPSDRMDGYARWLRLMIACALLAMARTPGQPAQRVLFLLDEFAHLGRMQPVRRDIGLAGGFGVTFWLVVQDLSQLRGTYGETWATFLANVDVLQAFGVNDWDTADYLSRMTGEATIPVESEGRSLGVSHGSRAQRQATATRNRSESGRRLLFPDEVRRLPRELQLLFVKGGEPLLVDRLNYLSDREWVGRAAANPLYSSVAGGAVTTAASSNQRPRVEHSGHKSLLIWIIGSLLTLAAASSVAGLRINLTGSLPRGLYVTSKAVPVRGSLVLACLPGAIAAFAKERGYVPQGGACPEGLLPVGKQVLAIPGDTVTVTAAGLRVNGAAVPNSVPLLRDRTGRALPRLGTGPYFVSAGELWLGSTYSLWSFDSRYFGALEANNVRATVRPLVAASSGATRFQLTTRLRGRSSGSGIGTLWAPSTGSDSLPLGRR